MLPRKSYRGFASVLSVGAILPIAAIWAGHTMTESDKGIVAFWLAHHPEYRAATDTDCQCVKQIAQMRQGYGGAWKPVPDYHPYIATGDFNGDGERDLAVVVVKRSDPIHGFAILVFNGPSKSAEVPPVFVKEGLDLRGSGLFYGPPRPKPYRLVLGVFESEGSIFMPQGNSYRMTE
jgi:hypothetical protein